MILSDDRGYHGIDPVDECHRISVVVTRQIRLDAQAIRERIDAWEPAPYPVGEQPERTWPNHAGADGDNLYRGRLPYADEVMTKGWLR